MARNLSMLLKLITSDITRPGDVEIVDLSYTDLPENVEVHNTTVTTSSMNVSVAGFPVGSAIDFVLIYNAYTSDETNYVTFTFTNAAGVSSAHRIPGGKFGLFPDVARTATPTLQASTYSTTCKIIIVGNDSV